MAFEVKKIDPKKIVEEFNNTKNDETMYINDRILTTNLTISSLCLGHKVITKSVIKSFAIHFDTLGVVGEDDNYFLNHYSPDFKMALDFVEEIFVQPASHDAGTALGAAILGEAKQKNKILPLDFNTAY